MDTRRGDALIDVRKRLIKTQIIGAIAAIFMGLAIYGLFVAKGDAFHPLLNHSKVLNAMLVVGIFLEIRHLMQLVPLLKRHMELKQLSRT